MSAAPPLSRDALEPAARAVPPVRMVHVGLGAFYRAHQAWYTAHAPDAAAWGVAAYTGRRPDAADRLTAQEGVYTLVERAADGDAFSHIGVIARAVDGNDVADFVRTVGDPAVAIITLTITEAGYRLDADRRLDENDDAVRSDIALLDPWMRADAATSLPAPETALGRILLALEVRRRAGAPPIAIVPCDNMPDNGALVRAALERLADRVSPTLRAWIPSGVSFVSTSVDRITPRLEQDDVELVERVSGRLDTAPVVTEPFSDWVLCGDFPSGRPRWEAAGARFVDDIRPWEARKLWMLNGAHTLLACAGLVREHDTVAAAVADPVLLPLVHALWDEAARNVPEVETEQYRHALLERFGNPRIVHRLAQIAQDSLVKLRVRVVPVARRERAAGRSAEGCAAAVAAYFAAGASGRLDVDRALMAQLESGGIARAVALLDPQLGEDPAFCEGVASHLDRLLPSVSMFRS